MMNKKCPLSKEDNCLVCMRRRCPLGEKPIPAKTVGAHNFSFSLYEDGSGVFSRAVKPKEKVYLDPLQVLDIRDDINRFHKDKYELLREKTLTFLRELRDHHGYEEVPIIHELIKEIQEI